MRGEALDTILAAVKAAKRIQPQIGDLQTALKQRLGDPYVNEMHFSAFTRFFIPF